MNAIAKYLAEADKGNTKSLNLHGTYCIQIQGIKYNFIWMYLRGFRWCGGMRSTQERQQKLTGYKPSC